MRKMQYEQKLSNFIFISCLIISIISFTSLIFPPLLIEQTTTNFNTDANIFELGKWAGPIIISNIIFFGFYFFYKKDKLPIIKKLINYINNHDLSKTTSLIIMIVLFFIYIIFTIDELGREEFELGDYKDVYEAAKNYTFSGQLITDHVRYFLLHVSYLVFDNLRIIPFMASVSLLLITYFVTLEITKKRLAAIIAFAVLLQSNLFLLFDTTASYTNFWTAFYLFSIYLIFRKPGGSHVSFILSVMSKHIAITLIPINFFAITISQTSKKNKLILFFGYVVLVIIIVILAMTNNLVGDNIDFDVTKIIPSMSEFGTTFRFDGLILLIFFPMLLILRSKSRIIRDKINFIFIAISFVIMSQPIMYSAINVTLQPYRAIPIIIFCAIGVGMIFANTRTTEQE